MRRRGHIPELDAHRIDVYCLAITGQIHSFCRGPIGGKLSSIETRAVLCALIVS